MATKKKGPKTGTTRKKSSTSKAKTSKKKITSQKEKKNKVIQLQQNSEMQFLNKEIYAVGIIGVSILLFVCVIAGENMGHNRKLCFNFLTPYLWCRCYSLAYCAFGLWNTNAQTYGR